MSPITFCSPFRLGRCRLPGARRLALLARMSTGVPDCAMKVSRSEEMGPLSQHSPEFHCGCYYDTTVPGGATPAGCHTCSGPGDCTGLPGTPACNNGFCEVR